MTNESDPTTLSPGRHATTDAPPYTLRETLAQLRGYHRGKRIFPIDTAIAALHWLERETVDTTPVSPTHRETVGALAAWLANDDPTLPEPLIDAAAYWLGVVLKREETR